MGLRHLTSWVLVGLTILALLAGCGSGAATPPMTTPTSTALPTAAATPTASPGPTASPTSTPKPTPTPEPVAGWPTVSRAGITMTETVTDMTPFDGRLLLSVRVTGLTPGEAVVVSSAGAYQMGWACGVGPEPCIPTSAFSCAFTSRDTTKGTAKATTRALAGSDGAATLMVDLLAAPPAGSCPTDPTSPWQTHGACWEPVTVTDAAHGLRLTPEAICTGP